MNGQHRREDLDAIRARGFELARDVLGLVFKREGKSWKALCPLHDETTPSFDYRDDTKTFHCYGCGWSGGDILALYRELHPGASFRDAVAALGGNAPPNGRPRTWDSFDDLNDEPELPRPWSAAPEHAPEPTRRVRCVGRWLYTDAEGRRLGYQDRIDDDDGKRFVSWRWNARTSKWEPKAIGKPRPLYGLEELHRRPDAPVLVCEGEKAADAAQTIFPSHVCVTSMGGSGGARSTDWAPLGGRVVRLWPDNDKPGWRYANDVAAILTAMDTSLRVVRPAPSMPSGWDLADSLPADVSVEDLHQLLQDAEDLNGKPCMTTAASKQTFEDAETAMQSDPGATGGAKSQDADWSEPEPLLREGDDPAPFPLDALPTVAREAAAAMATAFEAAHTLAGQCVTAAIVAAGQAHADVYDPATGSTKPTCQKFLLIARSGDRKSTCDGVAFRAFELFEAELAEVAEREAREYRISLEVFERMKRNAAPKRTASRQEIRAALLALGDPPQRPPGPKMLCSEPTFEGLLKQLHEEQPSAVIASGEAGTFLGGFAMSEDHRLKTAAGLSKLWDNGTAKRTRASERFNLNGRRVSLHLLSQPGATTAFLADEVLRSQGLHSRVLVASPNRPRRTGKPRTTPALTARMDAFEAAVLAVLRRPPNTTPARDGGLELRPPVYRLSPGADAVWAEWCAEIELGQNDGERLAHVCDLTNKAGEIALRLAASLACFENKPGDLCVTEDQARRAVKLSRFYVAEKLRLFDAGQADPETVKTWALMLRIVEKRWTVVSAGDCVKWKLPGCPTSDDATRRLGTLDRLGWLRRRTTTADDAKRGRPRGARFEVHPEAATHVERMRERLGDIGEMRGDSAETQVPEPFADSADIAEGRAPALGDDFEDL